MTKLYAEISKVEEQSDDTVKVWGYASSEAVDSDGETISAAAMKAAIPDYMKFGAVREMHGKSAAGTAIEIAVEDDGRTFFGAHIVDPVAVKKVKAGVYKGFSIGGSVTRRDELNKTLITGLNLVEISLVDRPANPEAVFSCFKADKGQEPAAKLPETETDGRLPEKAEKAQPADALTSEEITLLRGLLAKYAEKAAAADEDLQKAEKQTLAKMQAERDEALAQLEELKKQAAPPKGAVKIVGKEEDGGNSDPLNGFAPIVKSDGTLDDVATLVKAAQTGRL